MKLQKNDETGLYSITELTYNQLIELATASINYAINYDLSNLTLAIVAIQKCPEKQYKNVIKISPHFELPLLLTAYEKQNKQTNPKT